TGDAAALARPHGQAPLDIRAPQAWTSTARSGRDRLDPTFRAREPTLGPSADRRRAEEARHLGLRDLGAQRAARSRDPARPAPKRTIVAHLHPRAGCEHDRL